MSGNKTGAVAQGRGAGLLYRFCTALAVVVFASVPAMALAGCVVGVPGCGSRAPLIESKRTSEIPHVADAPIEVKTQNGAIVIEKSGGTGVVISAAITGLTQERLDATRVLAERKADNTLAVYVQWPDGGRQSYERCDFKIEIPSAKGVTAESSNGAITLVGLAGVLKADSANGAITIRSHDGDIEAETSNGKVTIEHATGKVKASSSNGALSISLADAAAGPVEIDASNGAVSLEVGSAFAGTLRASTSNGSLTIPSGEGIVQNSKTKRSAELVFGKGEHTSVLKTSNGSVTVKRR